LKFLDESSSSLGGLKASLLADMKAETTQTELQVLAILGEFLTLPWMRKF
jgi:hypothetical protein